MNPSKADKIPPTHPHSTTKPQNIAVFGATGSIGTSTLDILKNHTDKYQVYALSGYRQLDALMKLCQEFQPKRVAVAETAVDDFRSRLASVNLDDIDVVGGQSGLVDIAKDNAVDTIVASIVGSAGLPSTLAGVQAGKRVLLANKEALVMAGDLMMQTARQSGAIILPVDSEHNAIFQCLPESIQRDNRQIYHHQYGIKQLWLTASGGPFLHKSYDDMRLASVEEAVAHPNWSMGQKISVDSATMMNKGLELIEACYLFNLTEDKVSVAIHPQSIIHSMVEYVDGSILAQMGTPDMRTPIASCLAYPDRIVSNVERLDLFAMNKLEFIKPDYTKFANLRLAREAMLETQKGHGNWANISLNASNEVAVNAFLQGQISLTTIAEINQITINSIADKYHQTLSDVDSVDAIMHIDALARKVANTTLTTT